MLLDRKILIVGLGSMGGALLRGWMHASSNKGSVSIVTPRKESCHPFTAFLSVKHYESPDQIPSDESFDVVLFSVKPQILDSILPSYVRFVNPNTTFISIAAGKKIESIKSILGEKAKCARVMPNLGVAFGQGMSVAIGAHSPTDSLFRNVGLVEWIEDESLFSAVTAISGSGPAYLFYLTECLADAGESLGIPHKTAKILSRQTMIGAASLLAAEETEAGELRQRVTSPNGTTQAAFKILIPAMNDLLNEAVQNASRRASELSDA